MKSDLNALMQAGNFDAILVTGPGSHNPAMVYITGGGHFTGDVIQKRGGAPVLFCRNMERDEAANTGLVTRSLEAYSYEELLREAGGDKIKAAALRYQKMFADMGLTSGRVALYGRMEASSAWALFSALQALAPQLTLVGEMGDSLMLRAMQTKDEKEVARIRKMGQITTAVVGEIADFLTSHTAKEGVLVKTDGSPLTIGEVKRRINLLLAERGAENPEGTIFSIGRDAGVPHSSGNPTDLLRLGQTIVFDIYPCEAGGGYFYDFTRTWCLGYAPDEVQAIYDEVLQVYRRVADDLRLDAPFKDYQKLTCDLYEAHGHPTVQTNPQTQEGYVHSLGHGVGLHVHERPWSGSNADDADRLTAGSVFTIEPGLYYPERGLGVRLEDTVWMRPDGTAEILVPYPMDLVLPVK